MSIDERQSLTVITITAVCWAVRVIISAKTLWQAPAHSSRYLFSTMRSPEGSERTCTEIINLRALNHSHFHPSVQVVQMNPAGFCALLSSPRPNQAWEGIVFLFSSRCWQAQLQGGVHDSHSGSGQFAVDMHVFYSSFDVRQYTPIDIALTVKRLTRSILFWNVFLKRSIVKRLNPLADILLAFRKIIV